MGKALSYSVIKLKSFDGTVTFKAFLVCFLPCGVDVKKPSAVLMSDFSCTLEGFRDPCPCPPHPISLPVYHLVVSRLSSLLIQETEMRAYTDCGLKETLFRGKVIAPRGMNRSTGKASSGSTSERMLAGRRLVPETSFMGSKAGRDLLLRGVIWATPYFD